MKEVVGVWALDWWVYIGKVHLQTSSSLPLAIGWPWEGQSPQGLQDTIEEKKRIPPLVSDKKPFYNEGQINRRKRNKSIVTFILFPPMYIQGTQES